MSITRKKALIIIIGISGLIANSFVLYATFLLAYFSEGNIVAININNYGEAFIEFLIIPISIIFGIYAIFSLFKNSKPTAI